ncbi:hydroxyacylglutathione hydrolase [Aquabacterium sp. A3]|uniref:hydroxyacylglutathione hydrolase n=1 Tax=Aquabacterium sp. A3 TaxID=3132829 RepID=UPI0031199AC5
MNQLLALPAFTDNYVWLIHNGCDALVVDPGDAASVQRTLAALGLRLTDILVTHHHADHVGGLSAWSPDTVAIHGAIDPKVPQISHPHHDGDVFEWRGMPIHVLSTPGHTQVHLSYFLPRGLGADNPDPIVFVGDTLFSAGCGRVFDGTAEALHQSLQTLAQLPDATRVCAAHEYTLANLRFAQAVEPDNPDVEGHLRHCEWLRSNGQATLPSTMGLERRINPFLRVDVPAVKAAATSHGAATDAAPDVFVALRAWKNQF